MLIIHEKKGKSDRYAIVPQADFIEAFEWEGAIRVTVASGLVRLTFEVDPKEFLALMDMFRDGRSVDVKDIRVYYAHREE